MKQFLLSKKSTLKTNTWAGGTTTQLAIFPEGAEYAKFNFDFRISYATVEVPESTFTFMPGVTRHLTILKGTLQINHIGRYQKQLNKFDTDIFNGEWPTKAKGQVTDFNLMTRGDTTGEIETLILTYNKMRSFALQEKHTHTCLYLFNGKLIIKTSQENVTLNQGDFIMFIHDGSELLELQSETECEIIVSRVALNTNNYSNKKSV